MKKIRVLLVDDHAVLRAGLRALIDAQPDMRVVAETGDGEQALRDATDADIAIVDLGMPAMGGLEVVHRIRDGAGRKTRVIVLTMHDDPAYARAALGAGAAGFVTKDADGPELLSAIRAVQRGRTYVQFAGESTGDASAEGGVLVGRSTDAAKPPLLSPREQQVLTLLARGHTNREVAERLFLSVKTIETYRSRLGNKLGLRTRADLVRLAIDLGLLAPERDSSSSGE